MYSISKCDVYPSIALRGVVIFPGNTTSFEIGRKASVEAAKIALATEDNEIFLVPQLEIDDETPSGDCLAKIGVIAKVIQQVKVAGGGYQLLVEGISRVERVKDMYSEGILSCFVHYVESDTMDEETNNKQLAELLAVFNRYVNIIQKPSPEVLRDVAHFTDAIKLCDYLASNFLVTFEDRVEILCETDPVERCRLLGDVLLRDVQISELNNDINNRVRQAMQSKQKEAFLREQIAAIRQELGEASDEQAGDEYCQKIDGAPLPEDVAAKLLEENAKLAKMPFGTAEAVVIRNYIETCLELPWNNYSEDVIDLPKASEILNKDHDGLDKVKDRILEYLAVKKLKPDLRGQILLLVGPPGVGKTSVAHSIATATGKAFARISLGGIHDEAEIRGHRRTYIGAMPGRIIGALKQAKTSNPVILLDELDKLANDMHGDPTSALLEVLDPEQNVAFRDNFIEIPVDLSECLFIATANTTSTIPAALLDRMEVIEMNSYTDTEKLMIAKHHLIPKQIERNGLKPSQIKFTDDAIIEIMHGYTRESGVRTFERQIASICRKAARTIADGEAKRVSVSPKAVHTMLGAVKFLPDNIYDKNEVGVVNGLAWTSVGGEMLRVEALSMQGNGQLELTGSLGDVMKESAKAAISYIRKHYIELGVDGEFHKKFDLHIHVPEGAVPKDGPSAGVTITTAIVSELTGKPVRRDIAMTGEITLTGRVLPIGGLREKTMAAYKAGVKTVLIPFDNTPDLDDVDVTVRAEIEFVPVKRIDEVLKLALVGE